MIRIFTDNRELRSLLLTNLLPVNYSVGINMGGKLKKVDVILNSDASVALCNNRLERAKVVSSYVKTYTTNSEGGFPMIIKLRRKNPEFLEDTAIVENKKEHKFFSNLFKYSICEKILNVKREFVISLSKEDIFFSAELKRKEGYETTILMPEDGYDYNVNFVKPANWGSICNKAKAIFSDFDLDFATFKFVLYPSMFDDEAIAVMSVSPSIPCINEAVVGLAKFLHEEIGKKIQLFNKIKQKQVYGK